MKLNTLFQRRYQAGQHSSLEVPAGYSLKFTAQSSEANVSVLMYNPRNTMERINLPDTLKCQHTFKLSAGNCIYSDMGRVFCSVTRDDTGWIDSIGGLSSKQHVDAKWGSRNYQQDRNNWLQNGHDAMLVEMAKFGLDLRDLAAPVNLFSKVTTTDDGVLAFVTDHGKEGDVVELRFEMDTVVLFSTCPHPMNPAETYPRGGVTVEMVRSLAVEDDDPCLNHCEENRRGFINTCQYQPHKLG